MKRQDIIFEKFSRVADEAKAGGAGLGLAIVKRLIEAYGGTVKVSNSDSVGVVFELCFPLYH